MRDPDVIAEAARQLDVCSACRYCEGYCPVFPALERRDKLGSGDVIYLANLCHDCRACYQACMYTDPHPFQLDLPTALADVRKKTYSRYAWPRSLGSIFFHERAAFLISLGLALVIGVALSFAFGGPTRLLGVPQEPESFYRIVPYLAMLLPALGATAYALVVLWAGFARFWRDAGSSPQSLVKPRLWVAAFSDAIALRRMNGGGDGCYYPYKESPTNARRALHISLVAGCGLAFAATVVAAILQDAFNQPPPYPFLSAPVLLGSAGGLGIIVGASGLLYQKARTDRAHAAALRSLDILFLASLNLVAITGMALLALRSSRLLGISLVLHLASLGLLIVAIPYGKFVHVVYRSAALLLYRAESSESVSETVRRRTTRG